jgi:hypothetical protein
VYKKIRAEDEAAEARAARAAEAARRRAAEAERRAAEAAAAEAARRRAHEAQLREAFGMTLGQEQVGAVTDLVGFGVPIKRPGQPHTVLIGARRGLIRRHRELAGRLQRGAGGELARLGPELSGSYFTVAVVPAGRWLAEREVFRGAFSLVVSYSSDVQAQQRQRAQTGGALPFVPAPRPRPIALEVRGSDGFVARWLERPAPGVLVLDGTKQAAGFAGRLATEEVPAAEHAVEETLVLSGVEDTSGDGRGFWEDVREELKVEFRVQEPAAF